MKTSRRIGHLLFYTTLILIEGCSTPDVDLGATVSDQSYFPLRVGHYRIYQVAKLDIHQVACKEASTQSTTTYELKELIYDSVQNAEGGFTYLIRRYTRTDETKPWATLDTWSARINANQVIVDEGNTSYVKLVLPLKSNRKWNANKYNTLVMIAYDSITRLGKPYQLSTGEKYPITLTVRNDNRDFFKNRDERVEVYASMTGLIYRETNQLTYLEIPCYGEGQIQSGSMYTQTLKSTGRE